MEKFPVPSIHCLGRSGGTVIGKCLASLPGVAFFSELHPRGLKSVYRLTGSRDVAIGYHPLYQARFWNNIQPENVPDDLGDETIPEFLELMDGIVDAARAAGLYPLVRLWNHMDLVTRPFFVGTGKDVFGQAFVQHYQGPEILLVRHPLDHAWSLRKKKTIFNDTPLDEFFRAAVILLDSHPQARIFRHEDFNQDADSFLKEMSLFGGFPYDESWKEGWKTCRKVTGDADILLSTSLTLGEYEHFPMNQAFVDEVNAMDDYQQLVERLGYSDVRAA